MDFVFFFEGSLKEVSELVNNYNINTALKNNDG